MRIIGGEFKGRKLASLKGIQIRPTADRVKESIFNILSFHPRQANVLDLFAGTGAMGLEAISRGARGAIFIDFSINALDMVKKNIKSLRMENQTKAIKWDISKNLKCIRGMVPFPPSVPSDLKKEDKGSHRFNLVFIDPPYNRMLVQTALHHLYASGSLRKDAMVVVEHSQSEPIPDDPLVYKVEDQRKYGETWVSFLKYSGRP